jgi:hypothetical protein
MVDNLRWHLHLELFGHISRVKMVLVCKSLTKVTMNGLVALFA